MQGSHLTSARQQQRLRWLTREYGLPLVSAALGLSPATVAKFVAGDTLSGKSRRAIDRGFAELGVSLGLEAPASPCAPLTVLRGGKDSGERPSASEHVSAPEHVGSVLDRVVRDMRKDDAAAQPLEVLLTP